MTERGGPQVRELMSYGCQTRMHIVQLLTPQLSFEDNTKDIDFSPSGIGRRWEAGYAHTLAVLELQPLGWALRSVVGCDPSRID